MVMGISMGLAGGSTRGSGEGVLSLGGEGWGAAGAGSGGGSLAGSRSLDDERYR